jgi:1,5-anhydro-D-fructose reductase (1,5-anhydro-D-mannitol-forming)
VAPLGWGVVGIGRIVLTRVAPAILDDDACELIAGVSRDQGRADHFARTFGARSAYSDYDEMLADPAVQAVFIGTPNALHADAVVAAAEAGKHVLCDKPMATDVPGAIRAVEACRAAGVRLGVNFHYRHMPWVRDLRQSISDGAIGQVRAVQIEAGAGVSTPGDWRADPALAGLGTVYSHGVHVLDLLRYALDPAGPTEVSAMFDVEEVGAAVETQASLLLRLAGGALAHVTSNQTVPYPANDLVVHGSDGSIVGRNLTRAQPGTMTVTTRDGERTTSYPEPDAHRRCVAAFARSVLAGEEPDASGVDGLHSAVLCQAIGRSVTERRRVEVPGPGTIPLLG